MFEKKAISQVPIHDLIAGRWSGRAFDPERLPDRNTMLALLEAARWSPSCYGDQPWRFMVFEKSEDVLKWEQASTCISPGNRSWAEHAPVLILTATATRLSLNDEPNRWGQYDTGAAVMSLCLQATALGLMTHQMGGYDRNRARELFAIPEQYELMAMIAVGYQLPRERIPQELREREAADRARRPLGENFFTGVWETAYDNG